MQNIFFKKIRSHFQMGIDCFQSFLHCHVIKHELNNLNKKYCFKSKNDATVTL